VVLDDPEVDLAPGMSASAALKLKTGIRGVVVQRDAIMRYPDGRITVWVIKQENGNATVTERRVKPGLSFNGKVAINSGLSPDALVVIQGNESLHEGQAVTVRYSE
jgi:multidrug efflux pump subunit AcrA (membrane-fusion protein)